MLDERLTLRKLEIYLDFMDTKSISKTAEKMNTSTVSIHKALHSLEDALKCPLFRHEGRNLVPLESSKGFAAECRTVISAINQAVNNYQRTCGINENKLRLGTLYSLTVQTIPKLILGLHNRRPDLEVELHMGSNKKLLEDLKNNNLDAIAIALDFEQIDLKRFEVLTMFSDDLFIAASLNHSTEYLGKIPEHGVDLSFFRDQPFVSLSEGFATHDDFKKIFDIAGFSPKIVTTVNDIFSMMSLVQAGVGLAVLPGRMCGVYGGSVKFMRLANRFQLTQSIGLVFAKNREHEINLRSLVAEGRINARTRKDLTPESF